MTSLLTFTCSSRAFIASSGVASASCISLLAFLAFISTVAKMRFSFSFTRFVIDLNLPSVSVSMAAKVMPHISTAKTSMTASTVSITSMDSLFAKDCDDGVIWILDVFENLIESRQHKGFTDVVAESLDVDVVAVFPGVLQDFEHLSQTCRADVRQLCKVEDDVLVVTVAEGFHVFFRLLCRSGVQTAVHVDCHVVVIVAYRYSYHDSVRICGII